MRGQVLGLHGVHTYPAGAIAEFGGVVAVMMNVVVSTVYSNRSMRSSEFVECVLAPVR